MKFPAFAYLRPSSLAEALAALAADEDAVPVSGGQSLMTMLGFRMARPGRLVDISGLPELLAVEQTEEGLRIGAAVSHARIEDGVVPGETGAFLARVASGIAFRAIRNRGTIGGSLAHADPAADWPVVLASLDARVATLGPGGARCLAVSELIEDAMQTVLEPGELITAIIIPPAERKGFGLQKLARKAGEFAEALASVVIGSDGLQIWIGLLAGRPLRIVAEIEPAECASDRRVSDTASYSAVRAAIESAVPDAEPYGAHLAAVAVCRAAGQACALEAAQ